MDIGDGSAGLDDIVTQLLLARGVEREQQLGDDIVEPGRTVADVHITAAPAPALPAERAVDAEDG